MLKRDFTKSNKEYFKKNRNFIITLGVFLLVGIIVFAIFGMNGNFEINGYNEFSVVVTEKAKEDFASKKSEVSSIINSYDGKFDAMLIYGEGDDTKFVVRYLNDITDKNAIEINKLIAEELGVDVANVSEHIKVAPSVQTKDYIYTIASILLIITIATLFSYIRYNGASALAIMLGCVLGSLVYLSFGSILRLSIGMSYFAMMVILNLLIAYLAINLFETMHKSSWLVSGDYATSLETAIKSSKFRVTVMSIGLILIGLLFVLIAPLTIKFTAVNIMFMAVTLVATALYIVPFAWNVFITMCRKREYKAKNTTVKSK